jgi:uncharacterized protein (DUF2252 family)
MTRTAARTTTAARTRGAAEVQYPTRAEQVAAGRALRSEVPRSSHAELPPARRDRDPLELLKSQDVTRVPELLPIRYARMAVSPFTFYRGAAQVMADDLADTPRTGLTVQACGDAHLSNFGLFASPERRLVFDINDFDETLPGPWEWDVKRLAASLEVAGRENGYPAKEQRAIVEASVAAYRNCMRDLAEKTSLEVWYTHIAGDELAERFGSQVSRSGRKRLSKTFAKARTRSNLGALRRFVGEQDGQQRLLADPPLVVPIRDLVEPGIDPDKLAAQLRDMLAQYRETLEPERRVLLDRFRLVDMARKVVGVGSVGTRCWMLLLLGDDAGDPLFLQAKEAEPSALEAYVGRSEYDNAGQRVVVGQRIMQTVGDIFLGWIRVTGLDGQRRDFYLRQLRDWKGSAEVETLLPAGMKAYGELCGWTLARAHARSGDRIAIAAYLGSGASFDVAVAEFARRYADRNIDDHGALVSAIGSGHIVAAEPLID